MATQRPARRGRGRPARIDRASILAAAAGHDAEALTMPALADSLGVTTQALYRYFPNKRALLDALCESVLERIDLPDRDSSGWREWLSAIATAYRDLGVDYPHLLESDPASLRAASIRILDDTLDVMHHHGFSSADAIRAYELVATVGFLGSLATRRYDSRGQLSRDSVRRVFADTASPPRYEEAISSFFVDYDLDRHFRLQLDTVLDGIATRLGQRVSDS
jgi:AcrR family transcriptional regulator